MIKKSSIEIESTNMSIDFFLFDEKLVNIFIVVFGPKIMEGSPKGLWIQPLQ